MDLAAPADYSGNELLEWRAFNMSVWVYLHALLFAVALAMRLLLAHFVVGLDAPPDGEANYDQIEYELFAYNLSIGNGYVMHNGVPSGCRAPGTAFTIAPIYLLFGRDFQAARLWLCVLSAACVPIVGIIGHRLLSPAAGFVAAAWLAFYPGHAYHAIHLVSETPATLLTALAMLLALSSLRTPAGWRDLVLGVILGFTTLVRPGLAVMAMTIWLAQLVLPLPSRWRLGKAALVAFGTLATTVPWAVRNWVVMGHFGLATALGGLTFWGANNEIVYHDALRIGAWVAASELVDEEHPLVGSEVERDASAWQYGRDYRREHVKRLPIVMMHRLGRIVLAYRETTSPLVNFVFRWAWLLSLPWVVIGAASLVRRRPLELLVLISPLVAVLVTAISFFGCNRFRDGAAPALAIFVAAGLSAGLSWRRATRDVSL